MRRKESTVESPQEYYKSHGPMTAVDSHEAGLSALPKDIAALCEIIPGLLIHRELANLLYHVKLSEERRDEANIRPIREMLERIRALDGRPWTVRREPGDRLACVCRHFTMMLCAILRELGTAARARCGFGAYFTPGRFEDHWVCEYWNAAQSRWVLVDAQMDAIQRKTFRLDFDPLDVPRDRFIIAGDAWQMCRNGRADPDRFGLSLLPHLHGWWFIAGNILRDLASLNRMELLPWDVWGLMQMDDTGLLEQKGALLDRIAALTLAGDEAFPEVREVYESDDRLRVPSVVFNAMRQASETIAS
jgi:hypothetical protein